ncbi:MAG: 50S ribosomal protein L30 [candidate division NC10 bacterium]|nr:50S ribosomal protein L30 [candidate division NC10 bacterium]
MSAWLRITQRRSRIGSTPGQRKTLDGLGLRRIGSSVVRPDTPAIRGMVFKVCHLVSVEAAALPAGRGAAGPGQGAGA